MSRFGNKSAWWAVSVLVVIVVAVGGYALHQPTNSQLEISALPNDNFSASTQQRIDAVVTPQSIVQTKHRTYIVTGGLGIANGMGQYGGYDVWATQWTCHVRISAMRI